MATTPHQISHKDIIKDLQSLVSKEKAKTNAWFFKTGKGQYGEGDVFIGITVPNQRIVARRYVDIPLSELVPLLNHEIHEYRLTAILILVLRYERYPDQQRTIFDFYCKQHHRVNNWDLVDSSAQYIVGAYLYHYEKPSKQKAFLRSYAKSSSLWERRIAIVATHYFILNGQYQYTFDMCDLLMNDNQDLIHKACGWMLREIGKYNGAVSEAILCQYLDKHAAHMPRTMLRYAIERFDAKKKAWYMKGIAEKKKLL